MGKEDDLSKLARNPTLAALEPLALQVIAFTAETKTLRAGDVLFRRDEIANDGYVVLTGSVAVDPSGLGAATAWIVRPPGLIGDIALLTQTRRPATAIAREPTSVLRISRQLFHRVLNEFPGSAERLRQALGTRLQQFTAELGSVRRKRMWPDDSDFLG
ncbi:MAG TPA: cyclic nucleotide-binding domain-containing protein [Methylocella sp.]|jgi:CRP-like cAMP-binding protein|nr:cyclic nucleotide-binding domain-containing protein [Methylocella sp.]